MRTFTKSPHFYPARWMKGSPDNYETNGALEGIGAGRQSPGSKSKLLVRVRASGFLHGAGLPVSRGTKKSNFRLLVQSSAALFLAVVAYTILTAPALATKCPNEAVRAESNVNPTTDQPYDLGLPECRAYEMVSPPEKQGYSAILEGFMPAAPDGTAVEYSSKGNFGEPGYGFPSNLFVAERKASGWLTTSSNWPASIVQTAHDRAFSSGLTSQVGCGSEPSGTKDVSVPVALCVLWNRQAGSFLTTTHYPALNGNSLPFLVMGASQDLSTVVFQVSAFEPEPLLSNDIDGVGIYEVTGLGTPSPSLGLVNVSDAGQELQDPQTALPNDAPPYGARVGAQQLFGTSSSSANSYQAVSSDASVIYFTAFPTGGVRTLFARIGGSSTVAISEPILGPGACTSGHACSAATPSEGVFQGASENGRKVFFTTSQPLTNGDEDSAQDLYEAELVGEGQGAHVGTLTQISEDIASEAADVQGVVRLSADGSHIYFVATGVLTTAANGLGQAASPGADNLYSYDSVNDKMRFVTELCSGSGHSGTVAASQCPSSPTATDSELWAPGADGEAQTTPDGHYLVFDSYGRVINTGTEADTDNSLDVYRYDAETGELMRISIGEPSWPASNNGNGEGENATINPGANNGLPEENSDGRSISDNGENIVFVTAEQLQGDDVNGGANRSCPQGGNTSGCDVYAWHNGSVSMISDGQDANSEAESAVMSADAGDIFFTSRTRLVGQDTDTLSDVYDARIDGGFPAPTPEPSCSGEACQGAISTAPTLSVPGSTSFTGGTNLTPPPFTKVSGKSQPKPKSKSLTNAQKLAAALKACKRDKSKTKRQACEKTALKKYAPPKPKAKKKSKSKK